MTTLKHTFFANDAHHNTHRSARARDYPPAIVCFAFGRGPSDAPYDASALPTPGGTNRALTWSVCALLRFYQRSRRPRPLVLAQCEIELALAAERGASYE